MLQLFTNPYAVRGQISLHPSLGTYRKNARNTVSEVQEYYRFQNRKASENFNALVQLIKHSGGDSTADTIDQYNTVIERSPLLTRAMGFTSDFNYGRINSHKLFPGVVNATLTTSDYVSPSRMVTEGSRFTPVKALWIDSNNVSFDVHMSNEEPEPFGMVFGNVDIPLLYLMYRWFKQEQDLRLQTDVNAINFGHQVFVQARAMVNALPSQVDVTCVSAAIAIYRGTYSAGDRVNSVLPKPTHQTLFKEVATYALERISDAKMKYEHMLAHLPTVFAAHGYDAMALPGTARTTQVRWFNFLSRLRLILFLVDVGGSNGVGANRGYINDLQRELREIRSTIPYGSFNEGLREELKTAVESLMKL